MRERRRPIRDPEILELLEGEPELLAVVDAIAATQAPARRAVPRRILLAAAVAGIAALAVALNVQLGGRGLDDRALAAVGDGRVVHMIATREEEERTIVDLGSDVETTGVISLESWFDSANGDLRATTRRDGQAVADTLVREGDLKGVDPVVAGFVRGFRAALEQGELEVLRRDRLDGKDVVWVRVTLSAAERAEVAIDADTYAPLAFRSIADSGGPGPLWRVPGIESREGVQIDFTPAEPPAGPNAGHIESEREVSPAEANALLKGDARWPGHQVEGLELEATRAQSLSRLFPDGRRARSSGIELLYGDLRDDYVEIQQARTPEPAYGFAEGRLTFGFAPVPARGELMLNALGVPGRPMWLGQLHDGHVFTTIRSTRRDLIISAASSMTPIG